jgi:hypothetical protein
VGLGWFEIFPAPQPGLLRQEPSPIGAGMHDTGPRSRQFPWWPSALS